MEQGRGASGAGAVSNTLPEICKPDEKKNKWKWDIWVLFTSQCFFIINKKLTPQGWFYPVFVKKFSLWDSEKENKYTKVYILVLVTKLA